MTTKLTTLDATTSWAAPSDDDIRAWEALPRDEQLSQMRKLLNLPECSGVSDLSFADIVEDARLKARSGFNG